MKNENLLIGILLYNFYPIFNVTCFMLYVLELQVTRFYFFSNILFFYCLDIYN